MLSHKTHANKISFNIISLTFYAKRHLEGKTNQTKREEYMVMPQNAT